MDDVQPEIEVRAQRARPHGLGGILGRGGDQLKIQLDLLLRPGPKHRMGPHQIQQS